MEGQRAGWISTRRLYPPWIYWGRVWSIVARWQLLRNKSDQYELLPPASDEKPFKHQL